MCRDFHKDPDFDIHTEFLRDFVKKSRMTPKFEHGYNTGMEDGYNTGYDQGYEDAYEEAYEKGYEEGYEKGYRDGFLEAQENYEAMEVNR